MNGGANSDSIPMDLIPEILSRLPAKSIARFRCVSKPWKSIISRQDFNELFQTMSSSNPRLLIGIEAVREWSFFSSRRPQNHYGKSSFVVSADFHSKSSRYGFSYASGLFYFTKVYDDHVVRVICNPSTGQYAILPPGLRTTNGHIGFDPIGKQFKVLVLSERVDDGLVYQILTLGTETRWRNIKFPSTHYGRDSSGICINGVVYYISHNFFLDYDNIGCFDVRTEKFKFLNLYPHVKIGSFQSLINYKGKLCGTNLEYSHDGGFPLELRMWVLEDVEKDEWSTCAYTFSTEDKVVKVHYDLSVVGATASGEIVLAKKVVNKPCYVFYFNPETNTLLTVEIQGFRKEEEWSRYHRVHCFVDYVEYLNFDVMKATYAATSIRPPEQSISTSSKEDRQVRTIAHLEQDRSRFESVNKFDALYLLEDD